MEVGKLTVQRRHGTGKGIARKLRAQGSVPGICYGPKLDAPVSVSVNTRELKGCLDPVKRRNTVIDVTIEGDGEPSQEIVVMVKDYQIDKIRRDVTHVDFLALDTDKEIEVEVPIELTGKAKGLVLGGQLHLVRHSLDIRCKPADIPPRAMLDVSELDIGGVLHISDITLPDGVSAATPPRLAIVTCTSPEVEETEEGEEGEEGAADAAAPADDKKDAG